MSAKELPPLNVLRKHYGFNHLTGELVSRFTNKTIKRRKNGYVCVQMSAGHVMGHRIAWALHYGELPPPEMEIDHINGIRDDNRIRNLRLVSQVENLRNKTRYKNCKHGYPGILFESNNRRVRQWRAQIGIGGTIIKLGAYRCKTAAIFARKAAEIKHGFTGASGDKKWQL
jgi:hypothetical protein